MLSPMPPSTAAYVRTPGISLMLPTVYSATPAGPTTDRPGSTVIDGSGRLCRSHPSRIAATMAPA